MTRDTVLINNLRIQAITGKDYWNRPTIQPLEVSINLQTDFRTSSQTDDLRHSLNYAVISRNIGEFFEKNKTRNFKSFENIANAAAEVVLDEKKGGGSSAEVIVTGSKTEIRIDKLEYIINREKKLGVLSKKGGLNDTIIVHNLKVPTLIGVFTFERLQKQFVSLQLEIEYNKHVDIYGIIDEVYTYVENANFKTVEALIESVAQIVSQHNIIQVVAEVQKPNAITFSDGVGVKVVRAPEDFANATRIDVTTFGQTQDFKEAFNLPASSSSIETSSKIHDVYIAFGSNIGNQVENITQSIELLNRLSDTRVVSTSSLYESEPMYHLDQPKFINGVLRLSTSLSPQDLLKSLKNIEYEALERTKIIDNGPRSIDLDILLYDDLVLNEPNLIIPHIRMIERTFVLQPLCELISPEAIHPVTAEPFHNHLKQLYNSSVDQSLQKSNLLQTHVPLYNKYFKFHEPRSLVFDLLHHSHRTQLMGILNTTPDSFSDGGRNASVEIAIANALEMVEFGVDIIDIGGVSTRPGSIAPDEQEEWNRVVPIIQAIRNHENDKLKNIIISVDTYRAQIALEAIKAGGNIINDISGGLYDDNMFAVVAETGVPYILNHTRGTPETMSRLNQYTPNENLEVTEYIRYEGKPLTKEDDTLIKAVSYEIAVQYLKAIKAGVKRWQIITDPGIGFAKDLKQNLAIIRGTPFIKSYSNYNVETDEFVSLDGLPILLGPSRKKFIGTLTNEKIPSERVLTTGSVIMSCVGYQTDIVRVHDVEEMKKVLLLGDALYRDIII